MIDEMAWVIPAAAAGACGSLGVLLLFQHIRWARSKSKREVATPAHAKRRLRSLDEFEPPHWHRRKRIHLPRLPRLRVRSIPFRLSAVMIFGVVGAIWSLAGTGSNASIGCN